MPAAPASLNASTELHAREIALARSRGLPAEVDPPAVAIRASSSTCSTRPPDAGDITGCLTADIRQADCVAALRIAAAHTRLDVIDQLLAAATPVDGVDRDGSTALHEAAYCGRADSVRHLLAHGADPTLRDARFGSTPLGWCRHHREETGPGHGHDEIVQLLAPISPDQP